MTPASAPFLLLSIRAEAEAADDEYRAMQRFGGLDDTGLHRINLTHQPLGHIDLDDWSGVILGGGPYNVSDPAADKSPTQRRAEAELLELVERIVAADFPFLGCCYGVGTLGAVIGATIDRTYSEPVGGLTVRLTAAGRADPLFADLPEEFDAYGGHKEAAAALPAHALHLASSADCPVQAFRVGEHVYATQFHPELDADGICTRIDVYRHYGYFAPETADELKTAARKRDAHHPPSILRRFTSRYARPS
ncbi:glutamine amidotransferase [Mycolicibacterium palauense]|uniref:glutamine amidotransferase n=1 Tax=Mycolicibacterium palauense TaxID=2034511 RepID=UPI000BFF0CA9|nr:glutamine amidotransferase [Mycolicibacterium palauense]